jgi:hypothetical protein
MADQTLTVVDAVKGGILDVAGNGSAKAGNAAGGDNWYFANDGKTVIVFLADGAGGDTLTFTPVADKYGRTETLAPVVAAGKVAIIGPFMPELWNNSEGKVEFALTSENAADKLLAVRVANPS